MLQFYNRKEALIILLWTKHLALIYIFIFIFGGGTNLMTPEKILCAPSSAIDIGRHICSFAQFPYTLAEISENAHLS